MYSNDRDSYRQAFFQAWAKHCKQMPLEPMEAQLVAVMIIHPEYRHFLTNFDSYQTQEFALEENPFLHMSLHLAVRDQYQLDRPKGIKAIYQHLEIKFGNAHAAEHYLMQCLQDALNEARQTGTMPSDEKYLNRLKIVIK